MASEREGNGRSGHVTTQTLSEPHTFKELPLASSLCDTDTHPSPHTQTTHTPHLDVVVCVECEPVVDALRQHYQVTLATPDADPAVIQVTHIKVACLVCRGGEGGGRGK